MIDFWTRFIDGLANTTPLEYIAVFAGILSVWYSRVENILVYPVGLINTIIYVFLSIRQDLWGEASVNLYYTIMSIIGWAAWMKRDDKKQVVLHVTFSGNREWLSQIGFFLFFYAVIYFSLSYLKKDFAPGAIPWADALASSTAFTGMWLMTKKKVESWYWWLLTNLASVPLYFVKGYVFTSVYYIILFILAIFGLVEWRKRARESHQTLSQQ